MIVAPSILSADLLRLGEEVADVERCGADWHHIDVMDGHFVPPLTFGAGLVKALKSATSCPLDVHIMVSNPLRVAGDYAEAGADHVTFHVEATQDCREVIRSIRSHGAGVGMAINPETPVQALEPYLELIDHVLVMSVQPGYAGQAFLPAVESKIAELSPRIPVVVDGGIKPDTAGLVKSLGAYGVVAGSWVYGAPNRAQAIHSLR